MDAVNEALAQIGAPCVEAPATSETPPITALQGWAAWTDGESVFGRTGSNSWAVAGSHTADGHALLADDMHLGIRIPNIWYRASWSWRQPDGEARLLVGERELDQPNGLCFSPDESLLYVNDSDRGQIKAFDVAADGTLGVAISSSSRKLVMTGGPFSVEFVADGQPLDPGLEAQLEDRRQALAGVVDEFNSERLNGKELLHLVLVDGSRESV